jgi:transcriptional regulator with XRE-family HTH domain
VTGKKAIEPGPIGVAVAQNVETLRESRNLSYAQLSRRLTELGRPIAPLGLTRIRNCQRRVDVDDLVALALALDVSPVTLLLPAAPTGGASGSAAVTENGNEYPRRQIWSWLIAEGPIDAPWSIGRPPRSVIRFRLTAVPDDVSSRGLLDGVVDVEHLPPSLQKAVDKYARNLDKDDDPDN